ncbi:MAG: hypothetical protein U0W40_07325 [Acidimicrobiia bacterium]
MTNRVCRFALHVGGLLVVLGVAFGVTVASHSSGFSSAARYAAAYSPGRFVSGRVWTLPLSVLLLGHPKMIGMTSVMFALLFLPYAMARRDGPRPPDRAGRPRRADARRGRLGAAGRGAGLDGGDARGARARLRRLASWPLVPAAWRS